MNRQERISMKPGRFFVLLAIGSLLTLMAAREARSSPVSTEKADRGSTFTPLAGNLSKTLTAEDGPYLVTADIYVPSGKTVRIDPGVTLLFGNFTGLHVEGQLVAEASPGKPIVFTSEFDRTYNPGSKLHANPYDWNGIYIHESGLGSSLSNCRILYSVYGINSLTQYIRIDRCVFESNGRSDFVVAGENRSVGDSSFSYARTVADAKEAGVPIKVLMDPLARRRNIVRYSALTVFLGGCSAGAWFGYQWREERDRVERMADPVPRGPSSPIVQNSSRDFLHAVAGRDTNMALTAGSAALALIGAVGFSWSFTF